MNVPWNNPPLWHAINVHLPLALGLLGVPLVCVVAIVRGRRPALRYGAILFYVALVGAAWFATWTGERAQERLPNVLPAGAWDQVNNHEWMARKLWIFAAATAVLLAMSAIPRRWARQAFATLAVVASVTTGTWVILTGHSGGVAVYQYGLGTGAMQQPPVARAPKPAKSTAATSTKAVSYVHDVKPILVARCVECHAGSEPKGQLDLTTVAAMTRSGRKAGPGVVPGKPEESAVVQYIQGLREPRMPKGRDALPAAELETLRAWIASGSTDDSATPASPQQEPAPRVASNEPASWDAPVKWNPSENATLRRFLRLQQLPAAPPPPKVAGPVNNPIDVFITDKWSAAPKGPEPQLCDDATFVRRVYLDVIGMIPTADETARFCADAAPDKRERLVDALLARNQDYAAHWVPFWEEALCSNGNHQGGVGTHGDYRKWIFESFVKNKPYDTMVLELIDPSMPNHPPRYVLSDSHMRTVQSASNAAQVFLGTAMKCASCHSHFENDEWPQARAVAYAGFFAPKDLEIIRCERPTGQFVPTRFMFEMPGAPAEAPAEQQARLRQVAQLITDPANPRFARTIVNRLWKRYLGLGLSEPLDDTRDDRAASHPELLAWLADDFMRSGYDIKHTTRLILTSRTYQLRYDPRLADTFDAAKPEEPRFFRSPALRRLTAEQVLDSIAVATGRRPATEKRAYTNDESTPLTRSLGRPATRNEVSTARPDEASVVQALELLNGEEYHRRIYTGGLTEALRCIADPSELVRRLYRSTLSREPTPAELEAGVAFLAAAAPATPAPSAEVVWLDDEFPADARADGTWLWAGAPAQPVLSGKSSHRLGDEPAAHGQHKLTATKFTVAPGDVLFAHVYLDPKRPPRQIMLQWNANNEWHQRATWGEDLLPFTPRTPQGSLPAAGRWVRLEIPAHTVGFATETQVDGIAFDQVGGVVYWDKTGVVRHPPVHAHHTVGDMIWALLSGAEFHHVR